LPEPPEPRLWDGVSLYDSREAAIRQARRFPMLGLFVAAIRLPGDESIRIEKTLRDRHHYALWGDADGLLTCVVEVDLIEVG
jgi:hypothetical protein